MREYLADRLQQAQVSWCLVQLLISLLSQPGPSQEELKDKIKTNIKKKKKNQKYKKMLGLPFSGKHVPFFWELYLNHVYPKMHMYSAEVYLYEGQHINRMPFTVE